MGWKYYYYVVWESGNCAGGTVVNSDRRIIKAEHIEELRDYMAKTEKREPLLIRSFTLLERRWVWHE